jgi:DtxR family manganese transport transcriptional regulator
MATRPKRAAAAEPAEPPDAERQAAISRRTRAAHTTETAEDYVELIAALIETTGEARVVDIARRRGVAQATVVKTIARLQRDGLISTRPYRAIFLTDSGRRLAAAASARHALVVEFLRCIGVGQEAAERDAEGIEHHVGAETLAAFERVIRERAAEGLTREPGGTSAAADKSLESLRDVKN